MQTLSKIIAKTVKKEMQKNKKSRLIYIRSPKNRTPEKLHVEM